MIIFLFDISSAPYISIESHTCRLPRGAALDTADSRLPQGFLEDLHVEDLHRLVDLEQQRALVLENVKQRGGLASSRGGGDQRAKTCVDLLLN